MELRLHEVPRAGSVVRAQIQIVGLALRPVGLVFAIVLGIVTIVIGADIVSGKAASWFDSDEWFEIAIAAFLYPFAVWRGDRPFGPSFLWTLPVDRRRLALAKIFGGWFWLMTGIAIFVSWQFVLALIARVPDAEIVSPIALAGATATYLLGTAIVVGLRHPLRWLIGTVSVVVIIAFMSEEGFSTILYDIGFFSAVENLDASWRTLPPVPRRFLSIFLSLGAGGIALWAALSRHGERRRH